MSEQKKQAEEQPQGQELSAEQLEQVNGGILIGLSQASVAVQKVLPAVQKVVGDGSVMPTDQFSLNFQKVK